MGEGVMGRRCDGERMRRGEVLNGGREEMKIAGQ